MINGNYIMEVAPKEYPYRLMRGRYAYSHKVAYWKYYGYIPEGFEIHHKDGNKHNNDISNL